MELNIYHLLVSEYGWPFLSVTDIVLVINFSKSNKLWVPNFFIPVFWGYQKCQSIPRVFFFFFFFFFFPVSPISLNTGWIMDNNTLMITDQFQLGPELLHYFQWYKSFNSYAVGKDAFVFMIQLISISPQKLISLSLRFPGTLQWQEERFVTLYIGDDFHISVSLTVKSYISLYESCSMYVLYWKSINIV